MTITKGTFGTKFENWMKYIILVSKTCFDNLAEVDRGLIYGVTCSSRSVLTKYP